MITPEELQALEATLLPALERHQLRLLAHGLRSLQAAAGRRCGPLPDGATIAAWAALQPAIAADPDFRRSFVEQMQRLGAQLSSLAAALGRTPLELEIEDLIRWAERRAGERISQRPEQA